MNGCPQCSSHDVTGMEVPSVYDGVLYWQCEACGHAWSRDWTGFGRRQQYADEYAAVANGPTPAQPRPTRPVVDDAGGGQMSAEKVHEAAKVMRLSWAEMAENAKRIRAASGNPVGTMPETMVAVADLMDSIALGLEARGVTAHLKPSERYAFAVADAYLATGSES